MAGGTKESVGDHKILVPSFLLGGSQNFKSLKDFLGYKRIVATNACNGGSQHFNDAKQTGSQNSIRTPLGGSLNMGQNFLPILYSPLL